MNSTRDENGINSIVQSTANVGLHTIPYSQCACRISIASNGTGPRHRLAIDRCMRFSGNPGFTTKFDIKIRKRPCARHETIAALNKAVRVRADERKAARTQSGEQTAVVFSRLDFIIEKSGTQNGCR